MRPTSSVLTVRSTGSSSSSGRVRLRSNSCSTMTSLAPVSRRLRKVMVDCIDSRVSEQGGEIQKRFSAQKSLFSYRDVRGVRREHPHRNFQALAYWIEHRDCAVTALGSTNDSKAIAVERMKGIENLNVRSVGTQGIVRDGVSIPTFTALFQPAVSRWIPPAGFIHAMPSLFRERCSVVSSVASSLPRYAVCIDVESFGSMVRLTASMNRSASVLSSARCFGKIGS